MKYIKFTEEQRQKVLEKVQEQLGETRSGIDASTLKLDLKDMLADVSDAGEKPVIKITANAMLKMSTLINVCSSEIAWHGFVERHPNNQFLISDIIIYPQHVTGATVTTDDEDYTQWMMKLSNDQLDTLRFQGHSHVNMGVSPSGVDTQFYDTLLQQIPDDGFYIFAIGNKRDNWTWLLYDLQNNIIYEDKDIDTEVVMESGTSYDEWAFSNIEEHIEETKATWKETPAHTPQGYRGTYQGQFSQYFSGTEHGNKGRQAKRTKQCTRCNTPVVPQTKTCPVCKNKKFEPIDDAPQMYGNQFLLEYK